MMASSMMMIDESSRNNLINNENIDDDRRRRRNNNNNNNNQFYDQQDQQNYHNYNDDAQFANNNNNTRRQQNNNNNFNRRRNNNNNNNKNQRFNNQQQYQPQQQYQNWQPPPPPLPPLNEPQPQPYLQSQQFYDNPNEFMQYNETRNHHHNQHHQQQRRNNNNNNHHSQRNQRQQQQQPANMVPPDWDYSMNETTTNNETNTSRPSNNSRQQNQQQNRNRGNRGAQNNNNNNNNNRGSNKNKPPNHDEQQQQQQQNHRPEIELPSETTVTRNHQQKSSGPRGGGGGGKKFTHQNSVSSSVSGVSSITMSNRDQTRRDILTDQLRKNKYECMVCYQYIRNDRAIWSCRVCFHIFHLACVKKWAQSSMAPPVGAQDVTPATEWRCPGCQSAYDQVPAKSTCFCTKKLNPEHQFRGDNNNQQNHAAQRKQHQLAHSCGEVCARLLSLSAPFYSDEQQSGSTIVSECKHKCTLLCHPGPCPPCETMVTRACKCGKVKFQVKCSSTRVPICDRACEKMLACGKHVCGQICHAGECGACQVDVEQTCGCHGTTRTVKCGSKEDTDYPQGVYECEQVCGKQLACKNHTCQEKCHLGPCKPCGLMPSNLINCPCGKTPVRELLLRNKIIRTSCRDPVPTCEKQCERLLECAHNTNDTTKSDFHVCTQSCHTGECGPCERDVQVRCRCGKEIETVKCSVSVEARATKRCLRRCQKKKSCGRHQCGEMCCDDKDHICMQVCNKPLACGIHRCEELCHRGTCKRCLVASFEERVCQCGATIQYPPIRCGTKPLECPNKCTRLHACDHPVTHNCHWEPECPPCSYLTSKMCMGGHEMRHNIPCHMKDVSCGNRCNKPLAGCSHRCQRTCHKGECTVEGDEKCTQPCQKPRPHCDHVCGAPCHETSASMCPDTVCQEIVMVKCKCGLKSKQIKCGTKMYGAASQVMFENLASQIKEMLTCKSIDVATFKSQESLKRKFELECDDECFLEERNRNIGQALLTEASLKPKPIYSDFLKSFAREDMQFAQSMEKRFETLVAESKAPTNKTGKKSVQLPVMKQAERRFVHELAPYYGIETQSFDSEPQRNVCLYATREKTCLPAATLTQSMDVRRGLSTMPKLRQLNAKLETGVQSQLKVLNPSEADLLTVSSAFAVLGDDLDSSQIPQQQRLLQQPPLQPIQQTTSSSKDAGKSIDYFDFD